MSRFEGFGFRAEGLLVVSGLDLKLRVWGFRARGLLTSFLGLSKGLGSGSGRKVC